MPIELSIENLEKIVFYNKQVQRLLPELNHIFSKWTLGIRTGISSMAKDALLEFMNIVTPEQIDKIGSYIGSPLHLHKISSHLIQNIKSPLSNIEDCLEKLDFHGNISISRRGDLIYICNWR